MLLKSCIFFFFVMLVMNLLISVSSLGHSRCVEDEIFVNNTRKKIPTTHYIIFKKSHLIL